jgi:hypothetical protein
LVARRPFRAERHPIAYCLSGVAGGEADLKYSILENAMTTSGKMDRQRIMCRRLLTASLLLLYGAGGFTFFLYLIRSVRGYFQLDRITEVMVLAFFPIAGVAAFLMTVWSDRQMVVEFECDEERFRFRTLRGAGEQVRQLEEVVRIAKAPWRGSLTTYTVRFVDGSEVLVRSSLPNAMALVEWLNEHERPAPTRAAI